MAESSSSVPVLVGVSQWTQRHLDPAEAPDPAVLLAQMARAAAEDAHAGDGFLERIDTISLTPTAGWSPADAPQCVADEIGAQVRKKVVAATGGEVGLTIVNESARRIAAGESQVALVAGCNMMRALEAAQRGGVSLDWAGPPGPGSERVGHDAHEERHGLDAPIYMYPLLENALRARSGTSLDEHRAALGQLFEPFTRVAAENPYAWFPVARSADELITPAANNRMVAYPYTKYLNAVLSTDQAAALLMCSEAEADRFGIPASKRVYWRGGAETEERAWFVSQRPDLADSPSMRECARRTFDDAGVDLSEGIESVDEIDFYSCFPVAVEMACAAYGVGASDPRGLTVTGGLPYAGGPASGYTLHSVATMAERLRGRPNATGLTTGNGWYLTKHSGCLWSSEMPRTASSHSTRAPVATGPDPLARDEQANGDAQIVSYTVAYARDGSPARGLIVGETSEGRRFVANTPDDRALLEAFASREQVGAKGRVRPEADRLIFEPRG